MQPNVDASVFLGRAASTLPALRNVSKEAVRNMMKQANVLLNYAQKCFIATGRRPLPVIAAVLLLVLEANKVAVELSEVAEELHAGLWATRERYKECQAALVGIGQSLPWGKDITGKTVSRHLPFLLKYLELKTNLEKKRKRPEDLSSSLIAAPSLDIAPYGGAPTADHQVLPKHCHLRVPGGSLDMIPHASATLSDHQRLSSSAITATNPCETDPTAQEATFQANGTEEQPIKRSLEMILSGPHQSQPPTRGNGDEVAEPTRGSLRGDDPHCYALSDESILTKPEKRMKICAPGIGHAFICDDSVEVNFCSQSDDEGALVVRESGISEAGSTREASAYSSLHVDQKMEPSKWEALPPSFCAGMKGRQRRRAKIDRAKERILETRQDLAFGFGRTTSSSDKYSRAESLQENSESNALLTNERNMALDWEDLTIGHLLLSGASEVEIENGYYHSLLARFPERAVTEVMDDGPASYIRSSSEVKLLLELMGDHEDKVTSKT